jgi:hypothetical protein
MKGDDMSKASGSSHGMYKHGGSSSPLYRVWAAMLDRCLNPNDKRYFDYGGRGITVCARWLNDFAAFRDDMGERLAGTSLDRIDNDGPYSPENCRWATLSQQRRNSRQAKPVTAFGETKFVVDWVDDPRCHVSWDTLNHRLWRGMKPEDAITRPLR